MMRPVGQPVGSCDALRRFGGGGASWWLARLVRRMRRMRPQLQLRSVLLPLELQGRLGLAPMGGPWGGSMGGSMGRRGLARGVVVRLAMGLGSDRVRSPRSS